MEKAALQSCVSQTLNEAVVLDQQGFYSQAIHKYQLSIGMMDQLIRCETQPSVISALGQKRAEYENRIHILSTAIQPQTAATTPTAAAAQTMYTHMSDGAHAVCLTFYPPL